MDIDNKLDLCNQAYDAMRKLERAFDKEGNIKLRREASEICQKIMFFNISITPLYFNDKEESK